jgi:hypothetical protein
MNIGNMQMIKCNDLVTSHENRRCQKSKMSSRKDTAPLLAVAAIVIAMAPVWRGLGRGAGTDRSMILSNSPSVQPDAATLRGNNRSRRLADRS